MSAAAGPVAPKVGDLAILVFDARRTSDTQLLVTEVSPNGRTLVAQGVTGAGFNPVGGTYTLRRNGKYALKGGGQWSEYLRFQKAQP